MTINILKQLGSLTVLNLITSALSYGLTILLINDLGPEEFGQYSYILIVALVASIFVNYSTEETAPALHAKLKQIEKVTEQVVSVRVFFTSFIILFLTLYSFYNFLFALGILAVTLSTLRLSFYYELLGRNVRYSVIFLIERVTYIAIMLVFIYFEYLNLYILFTVLSLVSLTSLVFQFWDNKSIFAYTKLSWSNVQYLGKANISMVIVALATFSYGGLSRLIIEHKFDMTQLGIYSAGWQLIMIATLFQAQTDKVWRKPLSQAVVCQDLQSFRSQLESYFCFSTLPILVGAIFISYFSVNVVDLLFDKKYNSLSEILPIFCFYFIVVNLDGLNRILWVSLSSQKIYMTVIILSTLSLLVALSLLNNEFGVRIFTLIIVCTHALSVFFLFIIFYFKYKKILAKGNKSKMC